MEKNKKLGWRVKKSFKMFFYVILNVLSLCYVLLFFLVENRPIADPSPLVENSTSFFETLPYVGVGIRGWRWIAAPAVWRVKAIF